MNQGHDAFSSNSALAATTSGGGAVAATLNKYFIGDVASCCEKKRFESVMHKKY